PGGFNTTFGYDAKFRRTSTTYPSGVTLTQAYDGSGRLTSIVGKNSGGTTLTSFSYTYPGSEQAGGQPGHQPAQDHDRRCRQRHHVHLRRAEPAAGGAGQKQWRVSDLRLPVRL